MELQKRYKTRNLVFTVTNDLNYDQRMIRICTSLQNAGYQVLLIGKKLSSSLPITQRQFTQKRLSCFFSRGKMFYLEYNIKLFFFLLFTKMDLIGAIDLDTILPCYLISLIRRKKRVYDAHELFCEMKEVVSRPRIYKFWKFIEKLTVPHFPLGYTVNEPIKQIYLNEYKVNYGVIMNIPLLTEPGHLKMNDHFIIYQGAVNHGRSFETLIPAFQWIDSPIRIYGDGNFLEQAILLAKEYKLENKILFMGKLPPEQLREVTPSAIMGITLFENNGLSNYYSLGNRFFDYIHAGIPQLCVNYPAYRHINEQHQVALLIDDLSSASIAKEINYLLHNPELLNILKKNCKEAAQTFNWQSEEKKLLGFYNSIFS